MGTSTKTGKKKRKQNKPDFRIIPFGIFEEKIVTSIIREQIEIATCNPKNKEHLLFCKKDDNYINHSQLTDIFKRICREAGIKLDLPKGCHILDKFVFFGANGVDIYNFFTPLTIDIKSIKL